MNKDMRGKAHVVIQRLSDTWARTVGDPRVLKPSDMAPAVCPRCKIHPMTAMEVDVENEYLIGGKGIAVYMRCPCGYESEMGARTTAKF
jgi:hypothetical protein